MDEKLVQKQPRPEQNRGCGVKSSPRASAVGSSVAAFLPDVDVPDEPVEGVGLPARGAWLAPGALRTLRLCPSPTSPFWGAAVAVAPTINTFRAPNLPTCVTSLSYLFLSALIFPSARPSDL